MKSFPNKIIDYMFAKLFCEKTKTFYDFAIPGMIGEFEKYLPSPDVIRMDFPNPCGWCTGMEDGCITGGTMLEGVIDAYKYSKDKKFLKRIADIFDGLRLCASVSDDNGFLARNVSPVDCKTHYIDSSRDQYTHWISACCKYYESGLCPDADKDFIRKALCNFAKRAEKNVSEKSNWNLLNEKGGKGLVMSMWGDIMPHECMRLPMIYIAAWKVGGDEHYKDLYLKYRDTAIEKSEEIDFSKLCKPFAVNQMQLSANFLYLYDDDSDFKERCLALMKKLAQYGYNEALKLFEENFTSEKVHLLSYQPKPWNEVPAVPELDDVSDGYAYYMPLHFKSLYPGAPEAAWMIHDIGDALSIYAIFPGSILTKEISNIFDTIAGKLDLGKHYSDAPSTLLMPYYTLMNKESKF